jgi:hypothetical protein
MKGAKTKAEATKLAVALVKQMKGSDWRPRVFENMGWHWRAISGPVQVYPSEGGRFWSMIGGGPKDSVGGLGLWTPRGCKHFKDPNRAVRDALKHVEARMAELNETLAAARKAAGYK